MNKPLLKKFITWLAAVSMAMSFIAPVLPSAYAASGTLRVTADRADANFTVARQSAPETIIASRTGVGPHSIALNMDTYIVTFGSIDGRPELTPPGPFTVFMNIGTVTALEPPATSYNSVDGSPTGTLRVITDRADANFTVARQSAPDTVIAERTGAGTFNFSLIMDTYVVTFGPIDGRPELTPPGPFTVFVNIGVVTALEPPATSYNDTSLLTGTLSVTSNRGDAVFSVRRASDNALIADHRRIADPQPSLIPLVMDTYNVEFHPIEGRPDLLAPALITVFINIGMVTEVYGEYLTFPAVGTVQINVTNQDGESITNGKWQLNRCMSEDSCDLYTAYTVGTGSRTLADVPKGTYKLTFSLTPAYESVVLLSLNPQTLGTLETITFNLQYTERGPEPIAIINVNTIGNMMDVPPVGTIAVSGDVYLVNYDDATGEEKPALYIGTAGSDPAAPLPVVVDIAQKNTIRFGDNVPNFSVPADVSYEANSISAGSIIPLTGTYTTELAAASVTAQEADSSPVSNAAIEIGPAGAYTTFNTADANPVITNVNVIDAANEIVCGNAPGYRLLTSDPIAITATAGSADNNYTCLYSEIPVTTLAVRATLSDADAGEFEAVDVGLFQGVYPAGIELAAGTTNADGSPLTFGNLEIDTEQNYYLIFEDIDPSGYLTPRVNPEDPVYVILSSDLDEGVAEVIDGVYRARNATVTVTARGLSAGELATVALTLTGSGIDEAADLADAETADFLIADPTGGEYTVTCESPLNENPRKVATTRAYTFTAAPGGHYSFACDYIEIANAVIVNIQTQPVPATVTLMVNGVPFNANINSLAAGTTDVYEIEETNRFVLQADPAPALQVVFNPIPGNPVTGAAYLAPATINVTDSIVPGTTLTVGPGVYTETNEKEYLNLSTFGVNDAAIFVDGIEVRADGNSNALNVPISTAEAHTVSFAPQAGFRTPDPITISAGNQMDRRGGTRNVVGYFVENGFQHDLYISSHRAVGPVFIALNTNGTQYYIGETSMSAPLIYPVDIRNAHYIQHGYVPGFISGRGIVLPADTLVFSGATTVIGRYIADADAAYFHAGVRNSDPNFFESTTLTTTYEIDGVTENFLYAIGSVNEEGGTTYTGVFPADVVHDLNVLSFLDPITVGGEDFSPVPPNFTLDDETYAPNQAEGSPGSVSNPYSLVTEYVNEFATVDVLVTGDTADSVTLDGTQIISDVADGSIARFDDVLIAAEHVIACGPGQSGMTVTPPDIVIPAGSLMGGVNSFSCDYVASDTAALITIETNATDNPDLEAPVVLIVDGVSQPLGSTAATAGPAQGARLSVVIDATKENIISFNDVSDYVAPRDILVTAPIGSTDHVYTGTYIPLADAANVTISTYFSDTGLLTAETGNNILFDGNGVGANTYQVLLNLSALDADPVDVSFGPIAGYVAPAGFTLNRTILHPGDNTFEVFYIPSASAAYISVNTIEAEGEIFLNGVSLGTSAGETYLGPFVVDLNREDGNAIGFGPVAGFATPNAIVLPQGLTGLSADPANPTQLSGIYVTQGVTATLNIQALTSDTNEVLPFAELRVNGYIVGYGETLVTVNSGEYQASFGNVSGFVTPLPITTATMSGQIIDITGFYIQDGHAYSAAVIETRDISGNNLFVPIRFSADGGENVSFLGTGSVTINLDQTVDSNQIVYETRFTHSVTGEGYSIATPASGVEELSMPYGELYLGIYRLIPTATADLSTVDDEHDYLTGVPDAEIFVNSALAGTRLISEYEFEADVPTTVSFENHPLDATYNTPLPIYFTPVNGRTYPPIVGTYTHSCQASISMEDESGAQVSGEVTMRTDRGRDGSVEDDPDFYYGTGEPGTGVVVITLDETMLNVITVHPPVPNPGNLSADPETITIPAGTLDPATCPIDYPVTFRVITNEAFVSIATTTDAGADPSGAVISLNGTAVSDAEGNIADQVIDVTEENIFTFSDVAGFSAPLQIVIPANTLTTGERYSYPGVYVTEGQQARLRLHARDSADPTALLGAAINLIIDSGAPVFLGLNDADILVNINHAYSVLWGAVEDYLEPEVNPTPVEPALSAGETRTMTGDYTACADCADVVIRAMNTQGTDDTADDTILNTAPISINGAEAGIGEVTQIYPAGTELTISFGAMAGFAVPTLEFTNPVTVSADPTENIFVARYAPRQEAVFTFNAEDSAGASLNAPSRLLVDATTTQNLPYELATENLTGRLFTYQPVDGYATNAVLSLNGRTFTVPVNIRIVQDDGAGELTTYTEGDELTLQFAPFHYIVTGIYETQIRITKTADRAILNNLEVIQYTVRVDRLTDIGPVINISVSDTLTGTGTIAGNNGGKLDYIVNTTQLSGRELTGANCTLGAAQINAGAIQCALDSADNSAIVVYDLRADNTGIPVEQTSLMANTATVTTEGSALRLTSGVSVTVRGPAPQPPITGGGGGGGSGGTGMGGGHVFYKGNMELGIRTFVSIDGKTFVEANEAAKAFGIPENGTATLRAKVQIKNPNPFTARDIRFRHSFEQGKSDMTAGGIKNLKGARLDDKFGTIVVDKIEANATAEFTYEIEVAESGENADMAKNVLKLVHFASTLPLTQDGLTYKGIGDEITTYLVAGAGLARQLRATEAPVSQNAAGNPDMAIFAEFVPGLAHAGESVTLAVTALNIGDIDLTGIKLNYDYDKNVLKVLDPVRANDNGDTLSWTIAKLRPGQKAVFNADLNVLPAATETIRGISYGQADQLQNVLPSENILNIFAGAGAEAAASLERGYELARTGPGALIFMLAMAIAAFGWRAYRQYQYLLTKRLALQPV